MNCICTVTGRALFRAAACVGAALLALSAVFSGGPEHVSAVQLRAPLPTRTPRPRRAARTPRPQRYSAFPHDTKAHKLDCGTCHKFPSSNWNKVRTGDAAFPDITEYPRHETCVRCHTQQFFRGSRPAICSICHTNPSPRDSARHPFPNPREIFDASPKGKSAESDFAINFPHDTHTEIVSSHGGVRFMNAALIRDPIAAEESCKVCHQTMLPQGDASDEYVTKPPADLGEGFWLKRGTFKTVPTGHTTCFTCHSADTGIAPAPSSCGVCHTLKPLQPPSDFDAKLASAMGVKDKVMLDAWRRRDASGKFRHEWFSHAELSCATCHNVTAMKTSDPATKKVPMSACGTCHATATSDDGGAINYEIDARKATPSFACVKCHVTLGKMPVPASHLQAVAKAAGQ